MKYNFELGCNNPKLEHTISIWHKIVLGLVWVVNKTMKMHLEFNLMCCKLDDVIRNVKHPVVTTKSEQPFLGYHHPRTLYRRVT